MLKKKKWIFKSPRKKFPMANYKMKVGKVLSKFDLFVNDGIKVEGKKLLKIFFYVCKI